MPVTPSRAAWAVIAGCVLLAAFGARPYAGGWNDGSRLAAVESLVSRGTLRIDDSVFCRPAGAAVAPYDPASAPLGAEGTKDKLFIRGHFHSDKPAVVSLLMAGLYRAGMCLGLPAPAERPDVFCLTLTLLTAVGCYLASLLCLYRLGHRLGLGGWTLTAWLASFALATFALAYTRHVNNHVIHLAILSGVCLLAVEVAQGGATWLRLLALGTLAGLGFNLDLGSGPLLVLAVVGMVAWRTRSAGAVAACALGAAPWVAAGLAINHAIGGVLIPVNMVAAYSGWPGGPFTEANLTGFMRHSPAGLALYATTMLFGKHGMIDHNLPLLLCVPALGVLRSRALRPEMLAMLGWCAASWGMYAALSNNHSGGCCSIRWFVPFLAPAYLLLAAYLRQAPGRLADLLVLSAWGAVLGLIMWGVGPWTLRMVPLLTWVALGAWRARGSSLRDDRQRPADVPLSRAA